MIPPFPREQTNAIPIKGYVGGGKHQNETLSIEIDNYIVFNLLAGPHLFFRSVTGDSGTLGCARSA